VYVYSGNQIWIGTYKNGVNEFKEGLASIKSLALGDINTVAEDRHGNYWLGSNTDGIYVYDPRSGEVVNHYTKDNSPMLGNIMVGSCRASDGSIWFGSYNGGLIRCIPSKTDPYQATIVNWRSTGDGNGLSTNNVWSVTEDKWHRMWIATLGGGIQMLDLKTGKFRTWNADNAGLPSNYLTSTGWIKKGWLLVGTSWFWCFVNPVTGQLANRVLPETENMPSNMGSTVCVMEDSRGLIWQGSASGASVYDQKTKKVWLLDMTHGLFGSSVCSILEDQEHTMWVVTDHGVSKIIPEKQEDGNWQFTVSSYNNRDGLQQETYNQRSTCLTHDGLILIGGQGGLDVINPKAMSNAMSKERPIFSGLQIFDADVPVGKEFDGRIILDEALDVCREITLSYNDQFTIQLASDAGDINNGKRFVYRLEGFNENWVKTSELNPNITYNSLSAGSYTLHVRMLNDDGTFGEEESTLDITIRPALWRSRWMMLLYMLILAGAAWWWRRWFLKRQQQRMDVETLRRETEKQHWMSEMRQEMARKNANEGSGDAIEEPQREQVVLNRKEEDLVVAIKGICKAFAATKEGQKAKITCRSLANELMAQIDHEQLTTALNILLHNSVRFSPGNCQITVNLGKSDQRHAVIQVGDNGIGINDEYKATAFEPMIGNEGIGLDKVKDIVVAHEGTIRLEDNPGGGTVIVITLPIEPEVEIEEAVLMDEE
jgi:streptogramin lyase